MSVVVPAHDAERGLPALLAALEAQIGEHPFELLVADDCSTDTTGELLRASAIATPLRTPSRGGSAQARNLAIERAAASIIAFTDADCVPAPDWIEQGLTAMARDDVDVLVGAIDMPLGAAPSTSALIDGARNLDQERYAREGHGATANLWIRASVLTRIGLFNPNLISGADTELCRRAVAAGARIRYGPDVRVMHEPRRSPRSLARKCFRLGFGAAQHRRHARDPALRDRPRYWLHPGSYVPRRAIQGIERLEEEGYRFGRRDLLAMQATQHFCVRVPYAAGNLVGAITEAVRSGGSRPIPALSAGKGILR